MAELHLNFLKTFYFVLEYSQLTMLCMPESLCCPPEAITTLLIGYTPTQNKTFLKSLNVAQPSLSLPRTQGSGFVKMKTLNSLIEYLGSL